MIFVRKVGEIIMNQFQLIPVCHDYLSVGLVYMQVDSL